MAELITMPRLSDTMTEGKVAKWHKNIGDKVKEGDVLAEIETDKAVQDFESEFDGVLLYIGVKEGNPAAVDSILAIIGKEGEDISQLINGANISQSQDSENKNSSEKEEVTKIIVQKESQQRINISPLAKKIAAEKGIDITTIIILQVL